MTCDLGNGKFANRQQLRLSGSVLRLHRHSLQDGADKTSKPARIRVLPQFAFFERSADVPGSAPQGLRAAALAENGQNHDAGPDRPQGGNAGSRWGFGYGRAVLVDPAAAGTPQSKGTIHGGGAYGHDWFVDPVENITVVMLTNTAFEGMWGQFTRDVRDAIYAKR